MSFFFDSQKIEPDKDTAFLDAVVSMSSNDSSVFVGAGALRNSDIYAAINIIANDLASNRILVPKSSVLETRLNDKPNANMSGRDFKFALAAQMLLSGNSFALITDNGFQFIPNSQMTVEQDDVSGALTYVYTPNGQRSRQIAPDSILHFKSFTQDGAVGISPLYALQDELVLQRKGNGLLKGFFDSPSRNVLQVHKTDLSSDAKANIRNKFEQANKGALSTVILDDSMDLKGLTVDANLLKAINSNEFSTQKIASCFGLPQSMLNVEEVHSSAAQVSAQYYESSIYKYMDCFTSELAFKLGKQVSYDDSRLRVNKQQDIDNVIELTKAGVYSADEAKNLLGGNAI
ncbi:phage portal protein [Lactiplantibacillus plantarum]|uniref:phage portal protein n=2 Tax=Lactiplantibacillus plantarum TaxID=1590 RepID=UPI0008265531|nr:phage portal protein [Lactiplantibacillus plantarum]MZU59149.1 phage portal protein [Lactiplantibacillus plantarum]MZU75901.1 phage portal protein [Lactiplantibacillus plantarum]PCE77665.1 phage portal protein [Lactiplantibacillus plantarum]